MDSNCCRHCFNEIETLAHVLGFCLHGETLCNARHHKIRSTLAQALRDNNEEIQGLSETGSCWRVDILAFNNTTGYIIDSTICFELNTTQPEDVNNEKNQIYGPTVPYYLNMYESEPNCNFGRDRNVPHGFPEDVVELQECKRAWVLCSSKQHVKTKFAKDAPDRNCIARWVRQFETNGCLCPEKSLGHPQTSEETVNRIRAVYECSCNKATKGAMLVRKSASGTAQIVLLDHGLYEYLPSSVRQPLCRLWRAIVVNNHSDMKKYATELGVEDVKFDKKNKEVGKRRVCFLSWLFNNTISTTWLFSADRIGDKEMVFGEMRPRIRHRLHDIRLTVGENLGKNSTRKTVQVEIEPVPKQKGIFKGTNIYWMGKKHRGFKNIKRTLHHQSDNVEKELVIMAAKSLKYKTASTIGEITAELIKYGTDKLYEQLSNLFQKCLNGDVPDE
ncbi:hypothetical protein ANN_01212 [Periplaneta americana]|uniref:ABC1 atypical kinase-like domain-containing protein n=1 Tax=Periplaneta americana TaxID=6978 RepID=A0ABQ8TVD1_PERAM|nr:hypothetical protein ANN_01212 [Periplaneta americana]